MLEIEPQTFRHISFFLWVGWIFIILSLGLIGVGFGFKGLDFVKIIGALSLALAILYQCKNYYEHLTEEIVLDSSCVTAYSGIFFLRQESQIPYYKINNIQVSNNFFFHNIILDAGNDTTNIHFSHIEKAYKVKELINERIEQERHYKANASFLVENQFQRQSPQASVQRPTERPLERPAQNPTLNPALNSGQYPMPTHPLYNQQNNQPNNQQNRMGNQYENESITDELIRLNSLKNSGVLSEVEFEIAKKHVIMGK